MASEEYVTHREFKECQDEMKEDMLDIIEKRDKARDAVVEKLDEKVNTLNDLVLPLTVSMKQTAENTKEISESLKEFTKGQRETNDRFSGEINTLALGLVKVENIASAISDKKKYNAAVVVGILGLIGVFVTGLFQLAPVLFN